MVKPIFESTTYKEGVVKTLSLINCYIRRIFNWPCVVLKSNPFRERHHLKPLTVLNPFFDYLQLINHFVGDRKHPLCLIEPLSSLFAIPFHEPFSRTLGHCFRTTYPQLVSRKWAPLAPLSTEVMVVGYWSLLLHLNLEGKYMLLHLNLFRMFMYVGARPLYLSNFSSVSDFVSSTFFNLYTLQLLLNYAAFSIVKLFLLPKIQSVTPII